MRGFPEVGHAPCQWAWSFALAGDQVGAVYVAIEGTDQIEAIW